MVQRINGNHLPTGRRIQSMLSWAVALIADTYRFGIKLIMIRINDYSIMIIKKLLFARFVQCQNTNQYANSFLYMLINNINVCPQELSSGENHS